MLSERRDEGCRLACCDARRLLLETTRGIIGDRAVERACIVVEFGRLYALALLGFALISADRHTFLSL